MFSLKSFDQQNRVGLLQSALGVCREQHKSRNPVEYQAEEATSYDDEKPSDERVLLIFSKSVGTEKIGKLVLYVDLFLGGDFELRIREGMNFSEVMTNVPVDFHLVLLARIDVVDAILQLNEAVASGAWKGRK